MHEIKRALHAAYPPALAVWAYGMVLGAQASHTGLTTGEIILMTGINYAAGSEFAALNLWNTPPPVFLIACVVFLINSRHLVMGAALSVYLGGLPRWKALAILFFMNDETWAVTYSDALQRSVTGHSGTLNLQFYMICGTVLYLSYLGAATLGALVAPHMGNMKAIGFDMAFPAVFMSIVGGMWKGMHDALPWLISLCCGVMVYSFIPGPWYLISAVIIGLSFAFFQKESL